jgi:hypothetical protein
MLVIKELFTFVKERCSIENAAFLAPSCQTEGKLWYGGSGNSKQATD